MNTFRELILFLAVLCMNPFSGLCESPLHVVEVLRDFCRTQVDAEWRAFPGAVAGAESIEYDDSSWPVRDPMDLGGYAAPFWLRKRIRIPEHIAGVPIDGEGAYLSVHCEVRADVYVDGKPVQNLVPGRNMIHLTDRAYPGREIGIALQILRVAGPEPFISIDLHLSELAELRRTAGAVLTQLENALLLHRLTSGDEEAQWRAEFGRAVGLLDLQALYARDGRKFAESAQKCIEALAVFDSLSKEMNIFAASSYTTDPYGEYVQEEWVQIIQQKAKGILGLLNRFPDLVIYRSEAAAHRWLEEHAPSLHREIVRRANERRYVVTGGSWTDFDPGLVGEESIIRQYLLGLRYFRELFGRRIHVATFPGVPTFESYLPELLSGLGIESVLFDSIRGPFPWNLFVWEAPSGARVLAYYPPGRLEADAERSALINLGELYNRHKMRDLYAVVDMEFKEESPAEERIRGLAEATGHPLFPSLHYADPEDFMDRMASNPYGVAYPLMTGSVSLKKDIERLQSVPEIKRMLRLVEARLEDLEKIETTRAVLSGSSYPKESLDESWRELVFHERRPVADGTANAEVLTESRKSLEDSHAKIQEECIAALAELAGEVDTRGAGQSILVFNPLSWVRSGVVEVASPAGSGPVSIRNHYGEVVPSQSMEGGSQFCFLAQNVPPLGYRLFDLVAGESAKSPSTDLEAGGLSVKSRHYRFSINGKTGDIESLSIPGNDTNLLSPKGRVYMEPEGASGDLPQAKVEMVERGPVRIRFRVERSGPSWNIVQDIIAAADSPAIEFQTAIRQESSDLFRMGLETPLFAPAFVHGEAGSSQEKKTVTGLQLNGPIGANGWSALTWGGETGGLSLVQEGRAGIYYGPHELSAVFRPGKSPYRFGSALYPFTGAWQEANLKRYSEVLAHPFLAVQTGEHAGRLPKMHSLIQVVPENVMLGSVRWDPDHRGVLLRLWETADRASRTEITVGSTILAAEEITLLEEGSIPLEYGNRAVTIPMGASQVKTVRVSY